MMSPIGWTYRVGLKLPTLLEQNILNLKQYIYSSHPLILRWPEHEPCKHKPHIDFAYGLEKKARDIVPFLLKGMLPMTIRLGPLRLISIKNSDFDYKLLVWYVYSDSFKTCHNLLRNYAESGKPFVIIDSLKSKCNTSILSLLEQYTTKNVKNGIVNTLVFPKDEPIWPSWSYSEK